MSQLVVFRLNQAYYALPVQVVREITKVDSITSLPNSPEFIKGIVNLRGENLPILDLHKKLEIPNSRCQVVLVAEFMDSTVGLAVDEVREVSDLGTPLAPPEFVASPYIAGIINQPERFVMVLDLANIIGEDNNLSDFGL